MRAWIGSRRQTPEPPGFAAPANVVFVPVDLVTGHPAPAGGPSTILEAFIAGTEPRTPAAQTRQ
jgi:hypothetical protein